METSTSMTLTEARAILWLRNNRRPMGELLDEGYLDERRLTWAAEKAYDARQRQAAAVLLAELQRVKKAPGTPPIAASSPPVVPALLPALEAGLTLEQARATLWPFRRFKGQPMGPLVDTQQLTPRDLAFAIETAWDQRVRQAAIVLLAGRLNQLVKEPPPPAGPLQVVSRGDSYSERRQSGWTAIQGALWGAVAVLWIELVIYTIRLWRIHPLGGAHPEQLTTPLGIVGMIVVLLLGGGLVWLFDRLLGLADKKIREQIETVRRGREGEERVLDLLRRNLDGNWTLFRNVVLPGRNQADMDAVLVGPAGVWLLEIKNFTGQYRNFGEYWEYPSGKRRRLLKKSPSRQARANAIRLANFLKANGLSQFVEPVVIWANPDSPLRVESPLVPVWTLGRLPEELGNLWQSQTLPEATCARIVEALTLLCQRQARKQTETA